MAKSIGLGTVVKVDHDGDTTFTTVVQMRNPKLPDRKREVADVTDYDATLQTFVPAIEGESQAQFTLLWDPGLTSHTIITTLFNDRTTVNWQFLIPAPVSKTLQFAGFVEELTFPEVGINEPHLVNVTVRRTGAITIS